MTHALQLETDAKAPGLSVGRAAHLVDAARVIREYAKERLMPGVQEVTQGLIAEMTGAVDQRLLALAALAETGDTEAFKAERRAVLVEEAQAARQAAVAAAVEAVQAAADQAHRTRYNPPREAERDRSSDLADAEIMSRMRRGPEELEAEARGYLAAGNPRGAMIRLDAIALSGAPIKADRAMALREFRQAVEASLDDVIPHRKEARALEQAALDATREFAIAEATVRARLETALGRGDRAAMASIAAKMAAAPDAFGPGIAGIQPDPRESKRISGVGPARARDPR